MEAPDPCADTAEVEAPRLAAAAGVPLVGAGACAGGGEAEDDDDDARTVSSSSSESVKLEAAWARRRGDGRGDAEEAAEPRRPPADEPGAPQPAGAASAAAGAVPAARAPPAADAGAADARAALGGVVAAGGSDGEGGSASSGSSGGPAGGSRGAARAAAPAAPLGARAGQDAEGEASAAPLLSFYLGPNTESDLGVLFLQSDRRPWPVSRLEEGGWAQRNGVHLKDELCRVNNRDMEGLEQQQVLEALKARPLMLSFARSPEGAQLTTSMLWLHTAAQQRHERQRGQGEARGAERAAGASGAGGAVGSRAAATPGRLPAPRRGRLGWAGLGLKDEALPDAEGLSDMGVSANRLEELDLSKNMLAGVSLPKLLGPSRLLVALRVVKFFANELGDGSAPTLAKLCLQCPRLAEMHLSHNLLTAVAVREIIPAACKGSRSRRDGGPGLQPIAPPLWLRLENNQVQGASPLLDSLRHEGWSLCPAQRGCTAACCPAGRDVHLPYFGNQFPSRKPGAAQPGAVQAPVPATGRPRRPHEGHPGQLWRPGSEEAPRWRGTASGGQGSPVAARWREQGGQRATATAPPGPPARPDDREWQGPPRAAPQRVRPPSPRRWGGWQEEPQSPPPVRQERAPLADGRSAARMGRALPSTSGPGQEAPAARNGEARVEERDGASIVYLPRAAASLPSRQLRAMCLGDGEEELEWMRAQHPMCSIELDDGAGARRAPAVVIRPATGAERVGPVAASIALKKALRDAEGLVQAVQSKLGNGWDRSGGRGDERRRAPPDDGRHEVDGVWCDANGEVARIDRGSLTLLPGRDTLPLAVTKRPQWGSNVCFGLEFDALGEHWEGLFMRGSKLIQWASGDIWHRSS